MNREPDTLKSFKVYVNEMNTVVYYVEARNEQEAKDIYHDDFPHKSLDDIEDQIVEVKEI